MDTESQVLSDERHSLLRRRSKMNVLPAIRWLAKLVFDCTVRKHCPE